jgi:hypothetical protein
VWNCPLKPRVSHSLSAFRSGTSAPFLVPSGFLSVGLPNFGSTTDQFRQLYPPRLVSQHQSSSKWLAQCCAPCSLLSGARTCNTSEYNRDEKQGFVQKPLVPAFSRTTAWATETKNKLHCGQRSPRAAARYPRQAIHEEVRRSRSFSRSSVMLTEHYRRLAADYFCLGYYGRYTLMTACECKLKSGACLGGHWDMTRRVVRALRPLYLRL